MYMFRNSRILKIYFLILVVGILLAFSFMSLAEEPIKNKISDEIIPRFYHTNISFSGALHQLNSRSGYKLSICTEIPFAVTPPPGFKPRPGFPFKPRKEAAANIPNISLDFTNKRLGEILDTLMNAMKGKYYWTEEDGVINVIPVEAKDDQSYLLNKEVTNIRITGKTPAQALRYLFGEIFPEGSWHVNCNGAGDPEDPTVEGTVDIDIKKGTIRQVLNAIVRPRNYAWDVGWPYYTTNLIAYDNKITDNVRYAKYIFTISYVPKERKYIPKNARNR
ncbi:hypothetical protein H8E77_00900 [bacterium]|nr:hypothetical protein [bacterium]